MSREVLCLLQNFHGYRRGLFKRPTYDVGMINRSNATYCRFVPYLEAAELTPIFAECTPIICVGRRKKFATDLGWVASAVEPRDRWLEVIAFGRQASLALDAIGTPHVKLPHPVSFQWRRDLIVKLAAELMLR